MTCAIYRHFDAAGALLYVGISGDPEMRDQQHRKTSEWRKDVASTTTQWCLSRDHALALEQVAIQFEKPVHNIARKPLDASKVVENGKAIAELAAAVARDGRSMRAISIAAGFGPNFVQQILKDGKEPGVNAHAAIMAVVQYRLAELLKGAM